MRIARPLRSQPTRDRILAAARLVFSRDGYERATLRAIAAEAAANPALIIRYYGSKEGLFAAVATLKFELAPLTRVPRPALGEALVRHVMGRWEDAEVGAALAAMARAAISNEAARVRLVAQYSAELGGLLGALGSSTIKPEAVALLATQVLGLFFTRFVLRVPGVADLPRDVVIQQVGATVQRYVDL